jgi:hypothetical protein
MALLLALPLAACVDSTPIMLAPEFTPPRDAPWISQSNASSGQRAGASCRVQLTDIRDLRSDPQSLGSIGSRPVRSPDTVAWVRSGFKTLNRDSRIRLVDEAAADEPDVVLSVELLNAYARSVTSETGAANLVVRVRYGRRGVMLDEKVYRGADDRLNWVGAESEAQAAFNAALVQLLGTIDKEILARCAS